MTDKNQTSRAAGVEALHETRGPRFDGGFSWITIESVDPEEVPSNRPRAHLGWSLVVATFANVTLGVTAIATGATLVGVVACSALSIATCLLVLAEIAERYGIKPVAIHALTSNAGVLEEVRLPGAHPSEKEPVAGPGSERIVPAPLSVGRSSLASSTVRLFSPSDTATGASFYLVVSTIILGTAGLAAWVSGQVAIGSTVFALFATVLCVFFYYYVRHRRRISKIWHVPSAVPSDTNASLQARQAWSAAKMRLPKTGVN